MSNAVELSRGGQAIVERLAHARLRPYVVGGAVRDALLGSMGRSKDVDIEVHGADGTEALIVALKGLGRVALQGRAFGIVAVQFAGETFDVSLPPAGASVEQALARRDFTINAIAWDPISGEVIDPFGGHADLHDRVLRPVGPSFGDDPLRVLRGIQFVARFGLTPSSTYLDQSRDLVDAYSALPRERVWGEWRKLARLGRHIESAIRTLLLTTWDRHTPLLAELAGTPQDPEWHPEGDALTHSLLAADAAASAADSDGLMLAERELAVFAALLHDAGKPATTAFEGGRIASRGHETVGANIARTFLLDIGAPQSLADKVGALTREHMAHVSLGDRPTASAVRRLVRRLESGGLSIDEWARVVDADRAGRGEGSLPGRGTRWVAMAQEMPESRSAILRGGDLIERGWAPGPAVGEVLRASLEAQDDGEFSDHEGALRWVRDSGVSP